MLLGQLAQISPKLSLQWILAYPNLGYPNTSIIRTPNATVLLEYFVISMHSIKVNDCSIRVVEQRLYINQWASVIRTISLI